MEFFPMSATRSQNGNSETVSYVKLFSHKAMDFTHGSIDLIGDATANRNPEELKNALNMIISRHVLQTSANGVTVIGLNKFFVKGAISNIDLLHATRGYFTSVRPGYHDVLMNINTVTSAFYRPMIVSAFLRSMRHYLNDYGETGKLLKNRAVRIMYEQNHTGGHKNEEATSDSDSADVVDANAEDNRKRTVNGIGRPCSEQHFLYYDGTTDQRITVTDYFTKIRGAALVFPDMHAINVGLGPVGDNKEEIAAQLAKAKDTGSRITADEEVLNERAIWIPPELLEIEPGQQFGRRLGGKHTTKMLDVALRHPAANQQMIQQEGLALMNVQRDATHIGGLDVVIDYSLVKIPGRLLPVPQIKYEGDPKSPCIASWNIGQEDKFIRPAQMTHTLCVINMRAAINRQNDTEAVAKKLNDRLQARGITIVTNGKSLSKLPTPRILDWNTIAPDPDSGKRCEEASKRLGHPRIVLIIFPDANSARYSGLKRVFDCNPGIHTVCITAAKVAISLHDSIFDYLALKFNVKLGGQNHSLMRGSKTSSGAFIPVPSSNG